MFTSRAPVAVDFAFIVSMLAPALTLISVRWVRQRKLHSHRAMQSWLVVVGFAAVIALEISIRLAGGSGAFVDQANANWRGVARLLLITHAVVATLTYLAWAGLAIRSRRCFGSHLPGDFSRTHRRVGWLVFSGLLFTAVSSIGMYALIFVL